MRQAFEVGQRAHIFLLRSDGVTPRRAAAVDKIHTKRHTHHADTAASGYQADEEMDVLTYLVAEGVAA